MRRICTIVAAALALAAMPAAPATAAAARGDADAPKEVERGEDIVLVYREGPLEIRAAGRALSGGVRGERVRVLNQATHKTIYGEVQGPGVVGVQSRTVTRGQY